MTTGMLTNASETDLESFFWRKVAAASPASEKTDARYENGWNALSQAAHEEYSEAGRQPNVFYVRRGGRYYDFSGVSGLDCAEDSRAFAVTDIDGDGNLDLLLKSRLGPQVRVFQNQCGVGRKSLAIRLRGVKSNRDAIGARVEVDGKVKFVQAGSGYLSQHSKQLHFGLGDALAAATVRGLVAFRPAPGISRPARRVRVPDRGRFRANGKHSVPRAAAKSPESAIPIENKAQFCRHVAAGRRTAAGIIFGTGLPSPVRDPLGGSRRRVRDFRALPVRSARRSEAALWFLVDGESRAHKIYFAPPDPADLKRMLDSDRVAIALPFAGKYYTPPERNYSALGAAFFAAGYPDQALRYLERAPQDSERILFAIGKIHLGEGRWEPARRYLERGLTLAPESADGWNSLGAVDVGEGKIAQALAHFEKALTFRPDMSSALVNAGQAHVALGSLPDAERMFRRALEIDPKDAAAANQMGELLVRRQRESEARRFFQQAIAARRDYAPAINNLATALCAGRSMERCHRCISLWHRRGSRRGLVLPESRQCLCLDGQSRGRAPDDRASPDAQARQSTGLAGASRVGSPLANTDASMQTLHGLPMENYLQ